MVKGISINFSIIGKRWQNAEGGSRVYLQITMVRNYIQDGSSSLYTIIHFEMFVVLNFRIKFHIYKTNYWELEYFCSFLLSTWFCYIILFHSVRGLLVFIKNCIACWCIIFILVWWALHHHHLLRPIHIVTNGMPVDKNIKSIVVSFEEVDVFMLLIFMHH